jgi:hypothetical protein
MTAPDSLPLHALAEENLAAASPDLLRASIRADGECVGRIGYVTRHEHETL